MEHLELWRRPSWKIASARCSRIGENPRSRGLTTALVGFGGDRAAVVAAVLVYRSLTVVPTLVLGLAFGPSVRRSASTR